LEQVKNLDTEQLRDVLENYADLEEEILDKQDGVDPEENGDGDESVDGEGVDENEGDEEGDTCTKCEKGCILDFVFELRDVIEPQFEDNFFLTLRGHQDFLHLKMG
jgi:hypothetical protein